MLDIQLLRTDIEDVAKKLSSRGYTLDVSAFNELESRRKSLQTQTQELQA
ncbi:MAG: serine--tRNA ligase, partial [Burkholderiales bacterium]